MGLLTVGTPLHWSEAKKHADYIRDHGIKQFLVVYAQAHARCCDALLWGDEVLQRHEPSVTS